MFFCLGILLFSGFLQVKVMLYGDHNNMTELLFEVTVFEKTRFHFITGTRSHNSSVTEQLEELRGRDNKTQESTVPRTAEVV